MDISMLVGQESIIDLTDCYFTKTASQKDSTELYKITRFISAKKLKIRYIIPNEYEVSPNGVATLIMGRKLTIPGSGENNDSGCYSTISENGQNVFTPSMLSNGPFTLRFINPRSTSVQFKNETIKATRFTADCSGVKCCRYSHLFVPTYSVNSTATDSNLSLQEEKARDIYFFGQNSFSCRIHGVKVPSRK